MKGKEGGGGGGRRDDCSFSFYGYLQRFFFSLFLACIFFSWVSGNWDWRGGRNGFFVGWGWGGGFFWCFLSFFLIVDIALSLSPRFFFTSSAFESICSFFYLLIFTSSFFCCCWATLIPRDIGVCLHTCVFFSVFAADPLIWMAICNGDGCGWGLCLAFTFMCNVHAFVWRI